MSKKEQQFIKTVWDFYAVHGRHDLPWRQTSDPFCIAVSELMLQQTQVARVIPKYEAFLGIFKNTKGLAQAPLGDVLRAWQGLGYNRRAKFLWQASGVVQEQYKGKWPTDFKTLMSLPGIGPYTAGAIMVFAYNQPIPLIETNIRGVYLHHFFPKEENVPDAKLIPLIEKTFAVDKARSWGWALMDYGSYLKSLHGNVNRRSMAYQKQSKFKDSDRAIRGAIVRTLLDSGKSLSALRTELSTVPTKRLTSQLEALQKEGLVILKSATYVLP